MVKLNQPEDNIPDNTPQSKVEKLYGAIRNSWQRLRSTGAGKLLLAYDKAGGGELKLPIFSAVAGEEPLVPFDVQMALYCPDTIAGSSLDFIVDQIIGPGFHTTMNEEYAETAKIENEGKTSDKTAKEIVDDYFELIDLDILLRGTVLESVGFGTSFWHLPSGDLTKLKPVPLNAVERCFRGEDRNWKQSPKVSKIGYKLNYSWENARVLKPDELIVFRFNPIPSDYPFGFGILTRVCMDLDLGGGKKREAFYKVYGKAQRSEKLWLEKFARGNELWVFPGAGNKLDSYRNLVKSMPDSGARFVTDMEKANVQQVVPERARGADAYINDLLNSYILGLRTPLPKLFTTPGFTEASANAAIEMAERMVMTAQRFIKRTIEKKIIWPLIDQAGLNPAEADVRLNWGMPEALDFEALQNVLPVVLQAWQGGAIFTHELREILRTICRLPIEQLKKPEFITQMAKDIKGRNMIEKQRGKEDYDWLLKRRKR